MSRRVIAVVVLLLLATCAGAPPSKTQDLHNEITTLWVQIRDWRREAKMPLDPLPADVLANPPVQKRACVATPQVPRVCDDTCNLSDAICDNEEQICKIASELGPDDEFAAEKCSNAKASCKEAQKKCCECGKNASQAEPEPDSTPAAIKPSAPNKGLAF